MTLLERLRQLRSEVAQREGVQPYFVFHHATLQEIAQRKPETLEMLQTIKGLGPKKIARYGPAILSVIAGQPPDAVAERAGGNGAETAVPVRDYVARLNLALAGHGGRIRGEVGRIEARPQALYFDLRDPRGEAILSCIVFVRRYELMGVSLEEGLEVIVGGAPDVYPRTGRLNFRCETIELVGVGKLQQAYRALKEKLRADGLFDVARKRPIPPFVQRIGLITSAHGEAIHDFTSNLEQVGITVLFRDCRVEGARAVPELVAALEWFNRNSGPEVVVIARGGGSWESLQAFNNDAVCRAIAASRVPVLAGIGHERDVPLAAMVADSFVSTPTATAHELNRSWREAKLRVPQAAQGIRHRLHTALQSCRHALASSTQTVNSAVATPIAAAERDLHVAAERLRGHFLGLATILPRICERVLAGLQRHRLQVREHRDAMAQGMASLYRSCRRALAGQRQALDRENRELAARNPENLLRRGWSVVAKAGQVVRSARQLAPGDTVQLRFGEGGAESKIHHLTPLRYDPKRPTLQ